MICNESIYVCQHRLQFLSRGSLSRLPKWSWNAQNIGTCNYMSILGKISHLGSSILKPIHFDCPQIPLLIRNWKIQIRLLWYTNTIDNSLEVNICICTKAKKILSHQCYTSLNIFVWESLTIPIGMVQIPQILR